MHHPLEHNVSELLLSRAEIDAKVAEIGRQISQDYGNEEIVVICVLKGAMPFMADLVRHITCPVVLDYVAISSYGGATSSSGVVRFQKDVEEDLAGRHVLIVEDIVDTGLTLHYLVQTLQLRNPKSLKICCLISKPARRKVEVNPDYLCFTIEDRFIIGCGMDYQESYRNLDYVGIMRPEATSGNQA